MPYYTLYVKLTKLVTGNGLSCKRRCVLEVIHYDAIFIWTILLTNEYKFDIVSLV